MGMVLCQEMTKGHIARERRGDVQVQVNKLLEHSQCMRQQRHSKIPGLADSWGK